MRIHEDPTAILIDIIKSLSDRPVVTASDLLTDHIADLRSMFEFVRQVEAQTGVQPSINTLAERLTIHQLGQQITTTLFHDEALAINLRPGFGDAVFLLPGIAGAVSELTHVARAITSSGPVFGLAYPGLTGTPAKDSIFDLAEHMTASIRAAQPAGKVHLVGYSAGGALAIEIARRLGPDRAGLVAMIDTPIHLRHWPVLVLAGFILNHAKKAWGPSLGKPANRASKSSAAEQLQQWSTPKKKRTPFMKLASLMRLRFDNPSSPDYVPNFPFYVPNLPSHVQRVRDASILAMAKDRPGFYEGPVVYFNTTEGDGMMCKPSRVWNAVTPDIRYVTIPGGHASCVQPPYSAALGDAIGRHVTRLAPEREAIAALLLRPSQARVNGKAVAPVAAREFADSEMN